MSSITDNDNDRYLYLHIDNSLEPHDECMQGGITVHIKLDDEGIVVDAWQEDEVIASAWKLYSEFGVEVRELLTIEKQQIDKKSYSEKMQDNLEPINENED